MGSEEPEDYNRFPKANLWILSRDKEKPVSKTSQDENSARPSLSSREPLSMKSDDPFHPNKRRWSLSGVPVSETPKRFVRKYNAGEVRIAMTMKHIYFVDTGTTDLETLSSFRPKSNWVGGNKIFGVNSLEISRLDAGDWAKVAQTVKEYELRGKDGGPAVIVPGKLHGPLRYRFWKGRVNFILVANTKLERDSWMRELRHRVAPWDFLKEHIKEATKSYSKDQVTEDIRNLFLSYGGDVDPSKTKSKDTNECQTKLPIDAKVVSSNGSGANVDDPLTRQSTAIISCDTIATDAAKSTDSASKQRVLDPIPTKKRSVFKGKNVIDDLAASNEGKAEVKFSANDGPNKFQKQLQHGDMAEKFNTHITNLVGAGATITKLADQAKHVAEVAGKVGDIAKVVGGVSSVFHLVGLGAKVVVKIADEKQGGKVLPDALRRIMYFLSHALDSAIIVLMTDPKEKYVDMDDLLANHVFSGLQKMLDLMSDIEVQLMRPGFVRFLKSSVLGEVEKAFKELETNVIKIVHTRLITEMGSVSSFDVGDVPTPPSRDEPFVGREQELDQVQRMLSKYGSAVIASEAGFGKTQLMIEYADQFQNEPTVANDPEGVSSSSTGDVDQQDGISKGPERKGTESVEEPDGDVKKATRIAIWVDASGKESEVIQTLADVTETLIRQKLGEADRRKPGTVLEKLQGILEEREGEWLLCLDGADNADIDVEVDALLGRVCRMSDGKKGRVLITTCRSRVWWDGMKSEQKLSLKPYPGYSRSVGDVSANEGEDST